MKKLLMSFGVLALAIPVSACCQEKPPVESRKELMPFTISFTSDGKPVLLDAAGKPIEPTKLKYPLHATAIERIDSISLVQARGSHYKVVVMNGVEYHIKLKHK